MLEEQFDADAILREPEEERSDFTDEDGERHELILGEDRIIDPEEIPMDEDDLYEL